MSCSINKPFDSYFGGKGSDGTYQTIINHIKKHDIYIEPFIGGGTIFQKKIAAPLSIINDIDSEVSEKYLMSAVKNTIVLNTNALELLSIVSKIFPKIFDKKITIYCDPPYPISSRKSERNRYKHEMSDNEHHKLLCCIQEIPYDIIISSYPNKIYEKSLKNWHLLEFDNMTRAGKAKEWLFMNYKPDTITELHDYNYFGNDFRERYAFKQQSKNLRNKLLKMSELERNAYLELSKI